MSSFIHWYTVPWCIDHEAAGHAAPHIPLHLCHLISKKAFAFVAQEFVDELMVYANMSTWIRQLLMLCMTRGRVFLYGLEVA